MLTGKEVCWVLASYCLGCFSAGYYLVRLRTGQDIRGQGSGVTGARNAARVLGRAGFITTFLLDFGKGALAVFGARYFQLGGGAVAASIFAVVVGHMFPIQLRFHGGKGIATSLGALFIYNPWIMGILLGIFLLAFALIRSFTLAGLLAFSLAPLAVFLWGLGNVATASMCFLAILVLLSHRRNIREECAAVFPGRMIKDSASQNHRGAEP